MCLFPPGTRGPSPLFSSSWMRGDRFNFFTYGRFLGSFPFAFLGIIIVSGCGSVESALQSYRYTYSFMYIHKQKNSYTPFSPRFLSRKDIALVRESIYDSYLTISFRIYLDFFSQLNCAFWELGDLGWYWESSTLDSAQYSQKNTYEIHHRMA